MAVRDDIIFEALDKLGHTYTGPTVLGSTDLHVKSADRTWERVARKLFARHAWNFAISRVTLSTLAPFTPAMDYGYAITPPADYVRILAVGNERDKPDYRFEGGYILTNQASVTCKYVRYISDPLYWSPWVRELMVYALADALAYRVTNSTTHAQAMHDLYLEHLHFATALDESETQHDELGDFPLIEARFS